MLTLYPFQETGRDFLANRENAILGDDMGLGKTIQAIEAIKARQISAGVIVCPLAVRRSWVKTLRAQYPSAFIREIVSPKSRPDPRAFNIVNYDIVWKDPFITEAKRIQWPILVCDEAHFLKNKESKRTKSLLMRNGLYSRCEHRWMLTGTPILNRPEELYTILRALCPDVLGVYADFYRYAYQFCGAYQDTFGFNTSGASHLDQLASMLGSVMLRRMKRDVLKDLPSVTHEKIYLEPTDKLMTLVRKEKAEQDALVGEIASLRRALGVLKVAPAIQHLDDLLMVKDKVVVFAWHTEVIENIKAHFGDKAVVYTGAESPKEKEGAIDAFINRAEVKLFVGQLKAAGVGIDGLQKVCDVCVFVEMSYVPGDIVQAVDRLCRIGQDNPVLAQFLVCEDSMDEELVNGLTEKAKNIKTVLSEESGAKFVLSKCAVCLELTEFSKLKPACGLAVCKKCYGKMECLI
jgi:SWI/SNF-related matrix-associated actin-dependent regulator 1 of chromatin subfamily A